MIPSNFQTTIVGTKNKSQAVMRIKPTAVQTVIKLLANLYPNPINSSFREILTNAVEATRLTGANRVIVTLPDASDETPMLVIRDFGPGMDHEFMMTRYVSLADSTKNDNPDTMGGFGIGRLSPATYAEAWTVRVVLPFNPSDYELPETHDFSHVKFIAQTYAFSAVSYFLEHTDTELLTDGERGTEVSIPVPHDRVAQMNNYAVNECLPFFDVDIECNHDFLAIRPQKGHTWLYDSGDNRSMSKHLGSLVIDSANYPIDFDQIPRRSYETSTSLTYNEITLVRKMVMWVKVKDIDVNPNRTDLQYTNKTITNICRIVRENIADFKASVMSIVKEELANAKTLHDMSDTIAKYEWIVGQDVFMSHKLHGECLEDGIPIKARVYNGQRHELVDKFYYRHMRGLPVAKFWYKAQDGWTGIGLRKGRFRSTTYIFEEGQQFFDCGLWEDMPVDTVTVTTGDKKTKRVRRQYSGVYLNGEQYFGELPSEAYYIVRSTKQGDEGTTTDKELPLRSMYTFFDELGIKVFHVNPSKLKLKGKNKVVQDDWSRTTTDELLKMVMANGSDMEYWVRRMSRQSRCNHLFNAIFKGELDLKLNFVLKELYNVWRQINHPLDTDNVKWGLTEYQYLVRWDVQIDYDNVLDSRYKLAELDRYSYHSDDAMLDAVAKYIAWIDMTLPYKAPEVDSEEEN